MPTSDPFNFAAAFEESEAGGSGTPAERAAARTAYAIQQLPLAVRQVGWSFLGPLDSEPDSGIDRLIVGVAPWSQVDRSCLSSLAQRVNQVRVPVFVFCVDEGASPSFFGRVLPGVDLPTRTPVAALYSGAGLVWAAQGDDAVDTLAGPFLP